MRIARTLGLATALLALTAPLAGTVTTGPAQARPAPHAAGSQAAARKAPPRLVVRTYLSGLSHPWDVRSIGHGQVLITGRSPARLVVATSRSHHRVRFPSKHVWVSHRSAETGLMGLEVDPDFATNRRFYTCSGWRKDGGGHDVRVNAWTLNRATTRARLVGPLVAGFPSTTGRHGGCRLLIAKSGALVVGTGDAATGRNPESLRSLGGKTLMLDRMTGKPWPSNPFVHSRHRATRYITTYGHRNVQGLAQRRDGSLWSIEQGTYRDDEVNRLVRGGDYGYNPVPGYNESVPMTDQRLPGHQIRARWRSGDPTLATSGGTFVYGARWGSLDGALAVATLKAERMLFLTFDRSGHLSRTYVPAALRGHGRLRTAEQLPGGALLVTTDEAAPRGRVLIVRPAKS